MPGKQGEKNWFLVNCAQVGQSQCSAATSQLVLFPYGTGESMLVCREKRRVPLPSLYKFTLGTIQFRFVPLFRSADLISQMYVSKTEFTL